MHQTTIPAVSSRVQQGEPGNQQCYWGKLAIVNQEPTLGQQKTIITGETGGIF